MNLLKKFIGWIQRQAQPRRANQNPLMPLVNQAQNAEQRYLQRGDASGLDEAIHYWQQILQSPDFSTQDEQFQLAVLNDSAVTYMRRYGARGVIQDLDTGLQAWQALVEKVPDDSPDLPHFLHNFGVGLHNRYLHLGDLADLEKAIKYSQQAVGKTMTDSPHLAVYLNSLGAVLRERYNQSGKLADLETSITIIQQIIEKTPSDSPDLAMYLNNLGVLLSERYNHLGELTDLEASVVTIQQAIEKTPYANPNLIIYFNSMGAALLERYKHLGELMDLEAGITAFRQAIEKIPTNSPYLAINLSNLAVGLYDRYLRLGILADLEEAIKTHQQSIGKSPSNSPYLTNHINNLGVGLLERYARLGKLEDLEKAIESYQQAIRKSRSKSKNLVSYINNLGNGLIDRYLRLGDLSDLQVGINAYEQAIDRTPPDSPDLAMYLNNLGNGIRNRYSRLGNLGDLQAGIKAYQRAIELDKKGSLENLLNHSVNLLNWAFERNSWQEIEEVYPHIQDASRQLVEKQQQRGHQEAFLTETQGIAAKVAYARIQMHNPVGAVEALEQGVARLLSAALARDNADISQLRQDYPGLYTRYEQQRKAVKNAQRFYQNANEEQRKAAFEQWQQQEAHFQSVLSEIRQQPDQENFLNIATDINCVYQAAETRPLVYAFDTDKGGYALRIFKKEVQAIALSELTTEKWREQGRKYFEAYINAHNNQQEWQQAIDDLTAWLYTAIMQPIVSHLSSTEFTLIPIGYLNLFPLHLAWTEENGTRQYMMDKFTMNYAPNALALVNAQKSAILPSDNLLLINEPKPVEASELPSSIMESIAIKQHFEQNKEFAHEQATVSAVKEALNDSLNVLHFTCHGGANVENPLETGLLMANDEMLTVADFFQTQLQARLVSLSACQTGVIGFKKAEEVVGLPTSLLQAGAAGILASLWSVDDASTALLMARFYHNFMQEKQAPQIALREAQLWLRNARPRDYTEFLNANLPAEQAKILRQQIGTKSYSHPYYWGAFYYTGV